MKISAPVFSKRQPPPREDIPVARSNPRSNTSSSNIEIALEVVARIGKLFNGNLPTQKIQGAVLFAFQKKSPGEVSHFCAGRAIALGRTNDQSRDA